MKNIKWIPYIAIFLVILCIATDPQVSWTQNNPNTITFDNQSGESALVKVIGPTGQIIEVPNGESRLINVAAGDYYILVRYGEKPDQYKYSKGDSFTVTQTLTQYSVITITLHKVIGGNYATYPISPEEFDNTPVITQKVDRPKDIDKPATPAYKPAEPLKVESYKLAEPLKVESYKLAEPLKVETYKLIEPLKGVEPLKIAEPPEVEMQKPEKIAQSPKAQPAHPTTVESQKVSEPLTVIFQDKGKVEVNNWNFVYEYGVWDSPPSALRGYLWKPSITTRDLLLKLGKKTERGITYEDNQVISDNKLKIIRFGKEEVTITLTDGTILKIPKLEPSKDLIRKIKKIGDEKFVEDTELFLKGRGCLDKKCGDFSKRLDFLEASGKDPKEMIVEIRFGSE